MCIYERKYGCLKCPLPDCMADDSGHLAKKYLKKPKKPKKTIADSHKRAVFRRMGMYEQS